MTDHFVRSNAPASSRVAELHRLCAEDYAKGKAQRSIPRLAPTYLPAIPGPAAEPSDLDVAIGVGQQLLDSDQLPSVREALRLLLRVLGAEPVTTPAPAPAPRCPASHPEDPSPCGGPTVVTILDATNAGAQGCEHHAARLLASIDGGRVCPLPDAPDGAAIRVFKAASGIRPFPWVDAPRTRNEQLSRDEVRARGERP